MVITQSKTADKIIMSAVTNLGFRLWYDEWQKIRDCYAGEQAVKKRRDKYLPPLKTQESDEYEGYLQRAVFFNATARTVNGLTGLIFSKPPVVEDMPTDLELYNVSKDGLSFHLFSKRVAKEIISVGRAGVLLDMDASGRGQPYFVDYKAEAIRDWRVRERNGRWVLDLVILAEEVPDPYSPFQTENKLQYRMLVLDEDGFYEQRVYDADASVESMNYEVYQPRVRGERLDFIPFLILNPYDLTPEVVKPPILDIVNLNISHYQSYAQLEQGRWLTATPVFVISGNNGDGEGEYYLGTNMVWELEGNAKAQLLEFNGNGLKFLENACIFKEQQMAQLGGRLMGQSTKSAAESVEATTLREKQEQSLLLNVSDTLGEGFTKLLRWYSWWNNLPSEDLTVTFNTDLGVKWGAREIRACQQLYDSGYIPIEALYANLRDAEYVPDHMSFTEFKEQLPGIAPKSQMKMVENAAKERASLGRRRDQNGFIEANED